MSQYLDFRCGPYRLLLSLRHVVEIADAPMPGTSAAGNASRRAWRERTLPLCNLTVHLGSAPPERSLQIVILRDRDELEILDVDAVLGLSEVSDAEFASIAGLDPSLQALVDAVSPDPAGGSCRLRLRHPFAWHHPETPS